MSLSIHGTSSQGAVSASILQLDKLLRTLVEVIVFDSTLADYLSRGKVLSSRPRMVCEG